MLNSDLKQSKQWVLWKKDPKRGKVPYQFNGLPAATNDKETWETYDTCKGALAQTKRFDGIGIVLDSQNAFITVIDLDHCIDNGVVKPYAQTIIDRFNSYTEYSQSGAGVHIFILATKQTKRCRITVEGQEIEIYDSGRFIAVTENMLLDLPIENRQDELNTLCSEIFPQEKEREFRPVVKVDMSDHDLFEVMMKDKKFAELWTVPNSEHHSEQDQALCNKLAFYCGRDEQRIDYWFRQSPLMRDKWERKDYRQRTIQKAVMDCSEVYTPPTVFTAELLKDDLATVYDTLGQKELDKLSDLGERFLNQTCLFNEDFLSDIFSELNKGKIIWSTLKQKWYVWTGIQWQCTNDKEIQSHVKAVSDYLLELVNNNIKDAKVRNRFIKDITTIGNNTKSKNIVDMSISKMKYDGKFDYIPYIINCLDGIVNLKTGELLPHDKNKYCSKIAPCHFDLREPVTFNKFLNACINNDIDMYNFIQRMGGYCLTGEVSEQTGYFFFGTGMTGKSTLINLFTTILGEYAYSAAPSIFTDPGRFDLANLDGKRLMTTSELTKKKELASETFKAITSGDYRGCERKGIQDTLQVKFECKVIVATNELPKFDPEYAIKRRLKIIPFDQVVDDPDPWLPAKLLEEKDQIFTCFMVLGAVEYYKHGVGELEQMKAIKEKTIIESNELYEWFLETYTTIDDQSKSKDHFIETQSMWDEWTMYCSRYSIPNPFKSINTFSTRLKQQFERQGLTSYRKNNRRGFIGVVKK